MDESNSKRFTVVEGGRKELERRLIETLFTPYLPDSVAEGKRIAKQLEPRLTRASVTVFSRDAS